MATPVSFLYAKKRAFFFIHFFQPVYSYYLLFMVIKYFQYVHLVSMHQMVQLDVVIKNFMGTYVLHALLPSTASFLAGRARRQFGRYASVRDEIVVDMLPFNL
jgi:hypothetical protein